MHIGLTADSVADLLGHVSDLVNGIRQEVVCFQEVKGADGQQLKRDAHVTVVAKPVQHLHTVTDGRRNRDSVWRANGVASCLLTHCLLSGSCLPIFSSTLISSLAASLYFSIFLMIFRAIRLPPLCVETWFKSWKQHIVPTFHCYWSNVPAVVQTLHHLPKCSLS